MIKIYFTNGWYHIILKKYKAAKITTATASAPACGGHVLGLVFTLHVCHKRGRLRQHETLTAA
jgi:hypothetical protein